MTETSKDMTENTNREGLIEVERKLQREEEEYEMYNRIYVCLLSNVNQQPSNQTPFDFNQSVVELFRCQTKVTHSTQLLHQQQQMLWKI